MKFVAALSNAECKSLENGRQSRTFSKSSNDFATGLFNRSFRMQSSRYSRFFSFFDYVDYRFGQPYGLLGRLFSWRTSVLTITSKRLGSRCHCDTYLLQVQIFVLPPKIVENICKSEGHIKSREWHMSRLLASFRYSSNASFNLPAVTIHLNCFHEGLVYMNNEIASCQKFPSTMPYYVTWMQTSPLAEVSDRTLVKNATYRDAYRFLPIGKWWNYWCPMKRHFSLVLDLTLFGQGIYTSIYIYRCRPAWELFLISVERIQDIGPFSRYSALLVMSWNATCTSHESTKFFIPKSSYAPSLIQMPYIVRKNGEVKDCKRCSLWNSRSDVRTMISNRPSLSVPTHRDL